jgi:hypothetical protein
VDPREKLEARAYLFKLFEAADWEVLMRPLTALAFRRLGRRAPREDAEDLVGDAIAAGIKNLEQWDPADQTLLRFLGSMLNGLAGNRRRSRALQNERLGHEDDVAADSSRAPADALRGEQAYEARDLARQTMSRLEARLAGDALGLAVLRLFADGVTQPREQADALERPMLEILAARRRYERHASRVAAELEGDDDA